MCAGEVSQLDPGQRVVTEQERLRKPDDELLRRGMDLIEGFYHSISRTPESLP